MNRSGLTVEDFDKVFSWILDVQPSSSSDRKQEREAVTYTIFDDDGKLGLIGIAPGRGQSPEVQLKMCSKAANLSWEGPWHWFGSMTDPEYAFDERDRKFRTLCTSIFTYFLMIHNLDKAGRPKKVWEYLEQDATPNGDHTVKQQSDPTARTQERGLVFKRLKKENPTWSQARLALEANRELYEVVTADTVRNVYRAMGWKWERADRIR